MAKTQGALEYLIIIAAVLGIAAVSVLFLTSTSAAAKSPASISACRVAASNCGLRTATGVTTSCPECDIACKDLATGQEVFIGAATACKAGRTTSITAGSNYTIGLVQDSRCICGWTVASCDTWWYNGLIQKGFNVEFVDAAVLSDVNSMKKYKAILNPYGEWYLDYGPDQYTTLDNIREYVKQGGYWFEYGGFPFYYKCSTGSSAQGPYPAGSQRVCISISGPAPPDYLADNRNITTYGKAVTPNGPPMITGDRRPSVGNTFTAYSGCALLAPGASYNPLYFNSTYNFAGPVAHCYGSGCIVRSDKFTSNDADVVTIYADFMRSKVF